MELPGTKTTAQKKSKGHTQKKASGIGRSKYLSSKRKGHGGQANKGKATAAGQVDGVDLNKESGQKDYETSGTTGEDTAEKGNGQRKSGRTSQNLTKIRGKGRNAKTIKKIKGSENKEISRGRAEE